MRADENRYFGTLKREESEEFCPANRSYRPENGRKKQKSNKRTLTETLHDRKELDNDLGGRADHDLALAGLLGVVDGVKRIVEDGSLDHFGGVARFSDRPRIDVRYLSRGIFG